MDGLASRMLRGRWFGPFLSSACRCARTSIPMTLTRNAAGDFLPSQAILGLNTCLLLVAIGVLGCRTSPNDLGDAALDMTALQFDASSRDRGVCWGGATRSSCNGNGQCNGPFETCQHGTCCSGLLDPKTCTCSCNGGPECGVHEACCPGDKSHGRLPDLGVWMCRDSENECDCHSEPGVECSTYPDLGKP